MPQVECQRPDCNEEAYSVQLVARVGAYICTSCLQEWNAMPEVSEMCQRLTVMDAKMKLRLIVAEHGPAPLPQDVEHWALDPVAERWELEKTLVAKTMVWLVSTPVARRGAVAN